VSVNGGDKSKLAARKKQSDLTSTDERFYRPLYESPIISLHDYCCHSSRGGPGLEEESSVNNIVLMRHGAFSKHFGSRTFTADVNQAVFFSRDSTYRVSHPADCGDRGTVFTVIPRVLNDIVRELDPSIDEHPDQPFLFITGPCSSEIFLRHRELVQRLENAESDPLEPLWADVTALQLIADVLESAFAKQGVRQQSKRKGTAVDHAERAEAAKSYLASKLTERIALDEVAAAVNVSPFHFARIFQEHTGVPVHRYLTKLRLRLAMERLTESKCDLTELALDLGFSSHSHFSDSFKREFGKTPFEVRLRVR
jgi:AraC family transcriptional regulator